MPVDRVEINAAGIAQLKVALAQGALNYGLRLKQQAMRNAPVRGDHRSFAKGGPVGGTLRRSVYAAVFLDGQRAAGDEIEAPPGLPAGVVLVVGAGVNYAVHVHNGTRWMPARPFLSEALMETQGEASDLIEAGARRHLGGRR